MREQLAQYVELLFAGNTNTDEMKQEILQNTLDRYDDLIAQGKTPEAAYRLAVTGIGDINELLCGEMPERQTPPPQPSYYEDPSHNASEEVNRILRPVAVGLYILCAIPVIVLDDMGYGNAGLSLTLLMIAAATILLIIAGKKKAAAAPAVPQAEPAPNSTEPQDALHESIASLTRILTLAAFFIVSFATGAWYVTWVIFPLGRAIRNLIFAILDLKEEL